MPILDEMQKGTTSNAEGEQLDTWCLKGTACQKGEDAEGPSHS